MSKCPIKGCDGVNCLHFDMDGSEWRPKGCLARPSHIDEWENKMPGPDDYDDGRFDERNMKSSFRPGGRIGDELVELEGRVEHETNKAKLIEFTNGGAPKWCPKSQIVQEMVIGDTTIFHVKEWWAKKEGLI